MHRIRLRNLLSFGPDAQELTLEPLNVFIGPNGSGKSNLIDAIGTRILAVRPEFVWMHNHDGWYDLPTALTGRLE